MSWWFDSMNEDQKADLYMWSNEHWLLQQFGALDYLPTWAGYEKGLTHEMAKKKSWSGLAVKPKIISLALSVLFGVMSDEEASDYRARAQNRDLSRMSVDRGRSMSMGPREGSMSEVSGVSGVSSNSAS